MDTGTIREKKEEIILFDMNVEKCYSVRGITFRKIVYIMQKGV